MLWKPPPLFSILLFVICLLPLPTLIQAQSIVLLTFAVIGIGEEEAGEILWVRSGPPSEQGRIFQAWVTVQNAARSDSSCTQTIQVPVPPLPGLNSLTLYRDNGAVFVNSNEELIIEKLDECLDDAKRVVFQVGVPHPSASETNGGQDPLEPAESRVGLPNIVNQAVYDRTTGVTRASTYAMRIKTLQIRSID